MAPTIEDLPRARLARWALNLLDEIGLLTLWRSNINIKLICLLRCVRSFGFGITTIILVPFFEALGIVDKRIGLFMSMTLGGDGVMSIPLGLIADTVGRRNILAVGALLMIVSGVVFAFADNFWLLLAAAVLGVITPSGSDIGPFRPVEESTVAHLTRLADRASIYTWYNLLSQATGSLGLNSGWLTTWLVQSGEWTRLDAYRLIFLVYAVLGVVQLVMSLMLTKDCEANLSQASEGQHRPESENGNTGIRGLLPKLRRKSMIILFQVGLLYILDQFASGLVPLSWMATYFQRRFGLTSGETGSLFSASSIISAVCMLFAIPLARRIGNVKAMVFTHLPASVCLALIGIPAHVPPAITLVILRAFLDKMDSAPRTAFIAGIVHPHDLTPVMGILNVVRTMAQSLGPLATGIAAGRNLFWLVFLLAGSLKVSYDVGILVLFADRVAKKQEAAKADEADVEEGSSGEREIDAFGNDVETDDRDIDVDETEEPTERDGERARLLP